jgi:hypothetical protein
MDMPFDLFARQVEALAAFKKLRAKFGKHFIRRSDPHGFRRETDLNLGTG